MTVQLGKAIFDRDNGRLIDLEGAPLSLRPQSFEVLCLLAARPEEILSREDIFDAIWPDVAVTDDSLTQCIADIRKAIGDQERTILRTMPRKGYQLVPQSKAKTQRRHHVGIASVLRRWLSGGRVAFGAAVCLVILLGVLFERGVFQTTPEVTELRAPSIIVMPFEDLSPGGDMGHFADSMTEDLIVALTRWEDVRVTDRLSAMAFQGSGKNLKTVTTEVGANYAVEGSFRRIGDKVRITAQLVDGESGQNLWAERYDETGNDLLQLQDGVIARIEQTLIGNQGAVRADEYRKSWRKATVSLDEYDYYLRGHDKFYEFTKASVREAIAIWEEGLRHYPESGFLTVKLGWGHEMCVQLACGDPRTSHESALALAKAGLQDPDLPAPGHRFALWLMSSTGSNLGNRAQTVDAVREFAETYPSDTEGFLLTSDDLIRAGAFEEAEASLKIVAERQWSRLPARAAAGQGSLDYVRGDCASALPKLAKYSVLLEYLLMQAGCQAEAGQTEAARATLDIIAEKHGVRHMTDLPLWFHRNSEIKTRVLTQLAPLGWPLHPSEPPAIIVLPFRDLSPDASLAHFAVGMTEDILTGLSQWKEFQIVDRATAMSFKDKGLEIAEIARRTKTDYALEGSIRRIGGTMRVTAQLVDAATGRNLWAEKFDETDTDILALHDGIVRKIEQSLIGNFGAVRADEYRKSWAKGSVALDEYDYSLRGHSLYYQFTPEGVVAALDVWREGLERFPNSGLLKIKEGWGQVLCNLFDCAYGPFDIAETLALAREGLADPDLPIAGHRFGLWLLARLARDMGDTSALLTYAREIAETYPADVEGLLWSGMDLASLGAIDEALAQVKRAGPLEQRPAPPHYEAAAFVYGMAGQCDAAIPLFKRNNLPEEMLVFVGCLAESGEAHGAREILKDLAETQNIRGPADLASAFPHTPDYVTRLEQNLAKIGWPFASGAPP